MGVARGRWSGRFAARSMSATVKRALRLAVIAVLGFVVLAAWWFLPGRRAEVHLSPMRQGYSPEVFISVLLGGATADLAFVGDGALLSLAIHEIPGWLSGAYLAWAVSLSVRPQCPGAGQL